MKPNRLELNVLSPLEVLRTLQSVCVQCNMRHIRRFKMFFINKKIKLEDQGHVFQEKYLEIYLYCIP